METFEIIPRAGGGWGPVAAALARKADAVTQPEQVSVLVGVAKTAEGPHLVIEARSCCIVGEIHGDRLTSGGSTLAPRAIEALRSLGWNPPGVDEVDDPTWWRQWEKVPAIVACVEAVTLFVEAFELDDSVPFQLNVGVDDEDGRRARSESVSWDTVQPVRAGVNPSRAPACSRRSTTGRVAPGGSG